MKLFKSVDEKFAEIGFEKTRDDQFGVVYEREDKEFGFTQTLSLLRKANGKHIVQSYDGNLIDKKTIGCTCVGLTMYEIYLCFKKMKQMGWKMIR